MPSPFRICNPARIREERAPVAKQLRSVTKDKIRLVKDDMTAPVSSITVKRKSSVAAAERKQMIQALKGAGIAPENTGSFVEDLDPDDHTVN